MNLFERNRVVANMNAAGWATGPGDTVLVDAETFVRRFGDGAFSTPDIELLLLPYPPVEGASAIRESDFGVIPGSWAPLEKESVFDGRNLRIAWAPSQAPMLVAGIVATGPLGNWRCVSPEPVEVPAGGSYGWHSDPVGAIDAAVEVKRPLPIPDRERLRRMVRDVLSGAIPRMDVMLAGQYGIVLARGVLGEPEGLVFTLDNAGSPSHIEVGPNVLRIENAQARLGHLPAGSFVHVSTDGAVTVSDVAKVLGVSTAAPTAEQVLGPAGVRDALRRIAAADQTPSIEVADFVDRIAAGEAATTDIEMMSGTGLYDRSLYSVSGAWVDDADRYELLITARSDVHIFGVRAHGRLGPFEALLPQTFMLRENDTATLEGTWQPHLARLVAAERRLDALERTVGYTVPEPEPERDPDMVLLDRLGHVHAMRLAGGLRAVWAEDVDGVVMTSPTPVTKSGWPEFTALTVTYTGQVAAVGFEDVDGRRESIELPDPRSAAFIDDVFVFGPAGWHVEPTVAGAEPKADPEPDGDDLGAAIGEMGASIKSGLRDMLRDALGVEVYDKLADAWRRHDTKD